MPESGHGSSGQGSWELGGTGHGASCRHGGAGGGGARARDPFALPGTERRYARDRAVDVRHIRLDVAVDLEKRTIRGTARHTVVALNDDTRTVAFDAAEMTIEGVTGAGGKALAFEHTGERLAVTLAAPLAAGAETDVVVAYRATPRRGLYFIAPDDGYPDKPLQAWTQGQDEDSALLVPVLRLAEREGDDRDGRHGRAERSAAVERRARRDEAPGPRRGRRRGTGSIGDPARLLPRDARRRASSTR